MITECKACEGTGSVCSDCRQPDGICECDPDPLHIDFVDCDSCSGTGEVDE